MTYPKIELHVHLEGTVRPDLLLRIARRNDARLPVRTERELQELYRFRDFRHFIEIYTLTVDMLRTERDFREVVSAYAAEAKAHGAVYIEAIFGPTDAVRAGASWEATFTGYCDGAQQAWEEHGVRVNLTPDIGRQFTLEDAEKVAEHAIRFRDRGVVGLGSAAWRRSSRRSRLRGSSPRPGRRGSRPSRTPGRRPAPRPSPARSRRSARTGSATACARWRIPASCGSWRTGAPSLTCVRSRICAPASSRRCTSTRSRC
jgi:hypothetical protein